MTGDLVTRFKAATHSELVGRLSGMLGKADRISTLPRMYVLILADFDGLSLTKAQLMNIVCIVGIGDRIEI